MTVIDAFCESSSEDISSEVCGVLSLDDGMNCVIHKRAEKLVAGDNEPIEPEMPDESSIAEPEQRPIRKIRVRQEGENNTRLSKVKIN